MGQASDGSQDACAIPLAIVQEGQIGSQGGSPQVCMKIGAETLEAHSKDPVERGLLGKYPVKPNTGH